MGRAKKKKKNGAMQHLVLLWQVQRWPSSVRRDIWDGRYKAKAVNENHLFWSELARGNLQQWHQWMPFSFFPLSTLSHLTSIFSFFPHLCLTTTSPRLSLISPESFGLFGAIEYDRKSQNYRQVRDDYQAAIYFLIWP